MMNEQTGRRDDSAPPPGPVATWAEIPARSRLYSLAPQGSGTPLGESLTSYINRLAWSYRVSARALVALEIIPRLGEPFYVRSAPDQLSGFARCRAMSVNGAGDTAADWARTIERLTGRADLRRLTLRPWAAGLPAWGLLRPVPAWCPVCYRDWRERGHMAYQPLVWMLQEVSVCPVHRTRLRDRCLSCGKRQSAIAARTPPGCCTQCNSPLEASQEDAERETDNEMLSWQTWVLGTIEELRQASASSTSLAWDRLSDGIAACTGTRGSARRLGRRVNASKQLFLGWRHRTRRPSFPYLLRACYALGLSPLQLITTDHEATAAALLAGQDRRVPVPRRTGPPKADTARVEAFLQAVLDGREKPLATREVARHLGIGEKFLVRRYPRECAVVTAQYQAHRAERARQRVARECDEVRQATLAVHEEGAFPSIVRVTARLSNPNIMRRPEAKGVWRTLRRNLGYTS